MKTVDGVFVGILVLTLIAVLVSSNSQTTAAISNAASMFTGLIKTIMTPVSGAKVGA